VLIAAPLSAQEPKLRGTLQYSPIRSDESSSVPALVFSPDGKTLASASCEHTVKLWDVKTRKEVAILAGHAGAVFSLAFSPDGKTLASASWDGTIKLWAVPARGKPKR
jgi:WD40 repeat protein